ncbi:hypothetical protein GGTG_02988 [Gaeumannomyces tritici R3-111a-1]|uniref:HTH APSES-type domain-containing protein n=1 Tax=Gaeumannomyces tritici (strain R3-111a-1) TaxID=644352 RepID=J3NNY2_GAET3|nr:hypothetical protein GGTG_02988 [Gaeumannomyces tritici R3-111a-1]EJT77885.1 hypothetical protein GGTG_02988 [Gaeumannomyces tritici R3-111a-1]
MLPLASLMNPDMAIESGPMIRQHTGAMSSAPSTPYDQGFPSPISPQQRLYAHRAPSPPRTAPREVYFPTPQTKGAVNYPPHESLDDRSLAEVRRFQVEPFGAIRETCRHIPYNSNKKDFGAKTGMESLEVFEYTFYARDKKDPEKKNKWTVLWDYNVGLVRITNFFKCMGYSKTVPSRSLLQNPGLKNVTCSITGGSITAQGYWMPFHCARAMCAKFCYDISGALIPIFGPQFPAECVPTSSPEFGRFGIDPEIVEEAIKQANLAYYSEQQPALGGRHGGFHHHQELPQPQPQQQHEHYSHVEPSTPRDLYPRWSYGREEQQRPFSVERSPPYRRAARAAPFQGSPDYATALHHRGYPRHEREHPRYRASAEQVRSPDAAAAAANSGPPSPGRSSTYMDMDTCTPYGGDSRYRRRSQYRHRQTHSNTSLPSMQRDLPSAHSSPGGYRLGEPALLTPSPNTWPVEYPAAAQGGSPRDYPAAQSSPHDYQAIAHSSPGSPSLYESGDGHDRPDAYHRPGAYRGGRHTHLLGEHVPNPTLSAIPRSSQPWMRQQQHQHEPHHHHHHHQHPLYPSATTSTGFRSEHHYYRTAPSTPQPLHEEHFDYYPPAPSRHPIPIPPAAEPRPAAAADAPAPPPSPSPSPSPPPTAAPAARATAR